MNLYEIHSINPYKVNYLYYLYADKMQFNEVGRGVQFLINDEVTAVFDNYTHALKLTVDQFDKIHKDAIDDRLNNEYDSNKGIEWIRQSIINSYNSSYNFTFGK